MDDEYLYEYKVFDETDSPTFPTFFSLEDAKHHMRWLYYWKQEAHEKYLEYEAEQSRGEFPKSNEAYICWKVRRDLFGKTPPLEVAEYHIRCRKVDRYWEKAE